MTKFHGPFSSVEEMDEYLTKSYNEKPWHYKMKITIGGWWRHGWLWQIRPRTNYYRVKYFIQRGRRGWADCDTWSLDNYLSEVLEGTLKHLAETTHGWPQSDRFPTFEDWQAYLRDLADAFARYRKLEDEHMRDIYEGWDDPNHEGRYELKPGVTYQDGYKLAMQRQVETIAEMREVFDHWPSLWD